MCLYTDVYTKRDRDAERQKDKEQVKDRKEEKKKEMAWMSE